jgi:hypothetical protein
MKKLFIFLFFLIFIFFISCTFNPQIEVVITDIEQEYDNSYSEWGLAKIHYTVENVTGVVIDFYEIYFKVTCVDFSKYSDWSGGSNLPKGTIRSEYTLINTAGKKAFYAEVIKTKVEYF